MMEKITYKTTNYFGKTMWCADIEGYKGFSTYCFETKDLATLAAALFINSGCDVHEFHHLIAPTFRMWKIKSAWAE